MSKDVHARRRQKLLDRLGPGLLILPTASHVLRNGDVHYEFRPGSDFTYLCGFPEPEAVLVCWQLTRGRHRSILFVLPRDREREIWDGRRFGVAGAVRRFGVDEAYPTSELWKRLPALIGGHARVFHALGRDRAFDERLLALLRDAAWQKRRSNPPAHPVFEDPAPVLNDLRRRKEPEEILALARSAEITAAGHRVAMRCARPGMVEFQVRAELEAEFRRRGSPRNGYPSIVASGPNACILHYHQSDRTLKRGDLLLLDAGAEYGGYTADVTRTFPVSGAFRDAQRAVYSVVLAAQKAGIRAVRPGAPWDAAHRACVRALTRGLSKLGVLRGRVDRLLAKGAYRRWYMHGTSHWLGMDVHDVGAYQEANRPARLRPGMVLTVEPGLYFDARDRTVSKELRGIGVRIEDDVLVTRSGHRVLTAAAPKEIAEVEAACRVG
jgi:Xaa-Pro aminopeptidase